MEKYILHIKLVIPSTVLKGQMQPTMQLRRVTSSTLPSVCAAFCLEACALLRQPSIEKKAIVHQLISIVSNVRQSKYKNTLFLKGVFALPFLGPHLQHWEQASALLKQAETDLFLLAQKNSSTSPVSFSTRFIPQLT